MAQKKESKSRPFHWINKDSESSELSRSEGQEATSILRFVQRNRTSVRRRRQRPSSKTTHDFVAFETDIDLEIHESIEAEIERAEDTRGKNSVSNGFRSMQSRWRVSVPMNNVTEGSGVDPFAVTIVPMTGPIFSLLQYCESSILTGSGGYKLEACPEQLKPFTDMYQAASTHCLQNMVRFKHIIYPMLATFSRRMYTLNDYPFAQAQNPDQYLILATQAVRISIAEHIDDKEAMKYVATGVHFLICAAALGGRVQESKMHITGFLKLMPYVDTKSLEGYWEVDTASSLDILNATASGEEPIIKIAMCDPGPLPAARKTALQAKLTAMQRDAWLHVGPQKASRDIARYQDRIITNQFDLMQNPAEDIGTSLGSSLEASFHTDMVHHHITPVVGDLLDCLTVAKVIWRAPEFAVRADTIWLCKKSEATLHELLSLTGSKNIDTSNFSGQQAECLRLTLIIVLTAAQYRLLHLSRFQQARRLKAALISIVQLDWARVLGTSGAKIENEEMSNIEQAYYDPNEMALWMCMTGYWAATDGPEAAWFAEASVAIAKRLGLDDYEDLHGVMTRYLYSKTLQRESLISIANHMHR